MGIAHPSTDVHQMKVEKLTDIMRRVIANPANVVEVAEQISHDWFPMMTVNGKGEWGIVIGYGLKK